MNLSTTSLDRLHDIVVPDPVPLWPPAPGWYVVIAVLACCFALISYRIWSRWRANAYRRAALRELETANGVAQISEVLRRVALAISARPTVASLSGAAWPTWLSARCPVPMPKAVREQLAIGVYRSSDADGDTDVLRDYAARWISRHQTEAVGWTSTSVRV